MCAGVRASVNVCGKKLYKREDGAEEGKIEGVWWRCLLDPLIGVAMTFGREAMLARSGSRRLENGKWPPRSPELMYHLQTRDSSSRQTDHPLKLMRWRDTYKVPDFSAVQNTR